MSQINRQDDASGGVRGKAAKPVAQLLKACRHSFYLVFFFTAITECLAVAPMLYMMSAYDRVISTRSGVTLVSLTLLIVGVYLFWSALEWMRTRLLVRISLRTDWDLAADVFDASFRRSVGRRNVNVQQLMGDVVAFRQFMTGEPMLALMSAPFAIVFVIVGGLFHPLLAAFIAVAVVLMMLSAWFTQKLSSPILKAANDENAESQRVAADSLAQADATLALGMPSAAAGTTGTACSCRCRSTPARRAASLAASASSFRNRCPRSRSRSARGWRSTARSPAAW
jgi:ATP-binding cassette subfamily C exporter for protease/lipase